MAARDVWGGIGGISGFAGESVDALARPDQFGRRKVAVGAASGALKGAAAGAAAGPIGMGVGAAVGLAAGLFSQKKANELGDEAERVMRRDDFLKDFSSSSVYGGMNFGTSWAKYGGPLATPRKVSYKAMGGELTPISRDTLLVNGRKHTTGGVKIPAYNTEMEGGETIYHAPTGPYAFSDTIEDGTGKTFAETDLKLSKAMRKLESKTADPFVKTAMKMLDKQRQNQMMKQELIRELHQRDLIQNM